MKGTTYKRCACKDPDGKPLNQRCPDLPKRRHGTWTLDCRIDTTSRPGRRLKRGGYASQTDAQAALDHIRDLIRLAADDTALRQRVGDLIFERSRRGGQLPDADEVRRKLGAGLDIAAPSITVREWLEEWYAAKKRSKKASTLAGWRHHLDYFLIPLLGHIPRDKLRPEHIAQMFDTIDAWNTELAAAKEEGRAPVLPGDLRVRPRPIGVATQHRILQTLRNAYNVALRRRLVTWNPATAVELPPETRAPARVWSPEQVAIFLDKTKDDRLALLYRLVLLRGLRRGEVCGLRWSDLSEDGRRIQVRQTLLEIIGRDDLVFDSPKSQAGGRTVSLDSETAKLFETHRAAQRREKFAAGEAYTDHGLVFAREDGSPLRPSWVKWYWRKLAAQAGLPWIRLHDGRHTAATLALEAGLDIKIVSDQLGHSTTAITQDLYTHVRPAVHDEAAEQVLRLLPDRSAKGVG